MQTAMYVLYMGIRLMPLNYDGIKVVEHVVKDESETGNSLIVSGQPAVVTRTDAHGFTTTFVNANNEDVGFAVDFNTRKFEVNKSWRIKMTYPETAFQDIISQSSGTTMRGWNFFSFRNEILFDSLSPTIVISTTPNQQVLLWKLPVDVECLSTPYFQHSIGVNIRANSNSEFTCHFYSPADLTMDGKVDATDLAIVNGGWNTPAGDINGDGTTDAADMSILLDSWTPTTTE